jgi:hypothetical protein
MPSVFEVLSKDHAKVKRMLAELEAGPTRATGADQMQLMLRKRMVGELVMEESKHEAVEEMYFWPAVREHLANGDELADRALQQEQEGKQVLDELDRLDASQPEFEGLLASFIKEAREHVAYEENKVWPGLAAVLTAQESSDLAAKLEDGKNTVPTRPHPSVPPQRGVLKGTGPIAAAADKLRDAISGRGWG